MLKYCSSGALIQAMSHGTIWGFKTYFLIVFSNMGGGNGQAH